METVQTSNKHDARARQINAEASKQVLGCQRRDVLMERGLSLNYYVAGRTWEWFSCVTAACNSIVYVWDSLLRRTNEQHNAMPTSSSAGYGERQLPVDLALVHWTINGTSNPMICLLFAIWSAPNASSTRICLPCLINPRNRSSVSLSPSRGGPGHGLDWIGANRTAAHSDQRNFMCIDR